MGKLGKLDRLRGALWGMFVGDALAMPVQWYYDVAALQRDIGTLRDFQSPPECHPSSIMSLANTGAAGRGSQQGEVVGALDPLARRVAVRQPTGKEAMSTALIFKLGLVVTAITSAAVIQVGISEAADPNHSRPEDLAGWERSLVERERA